MCGQKLRTVLSFPLRGIVGFGLVIGGGVVLDDILVMAYFQLTNPTVPALNMGNSEELRSYSISIVLSTIIT